MRGQPPRITVAAGCELAAGWYVFSGLVRTSFLSAIAVGLAFLFTPSPAIGETRHALVVGNDSYQSVPGLARARNDARAIDVALRRAGFVTELVEDTTQTQFAEAIARLSVRIEPGDTVLFFYAGHGIEMGGQNYLMPIDVPSVRAGQEIVLTSKSVAISDVLDTLRARGAHVTILILDACRDNPFKDKDTRGIGGKRGLAPFAAPFGTFILYSAGIGQAANDALTDDDTDPNSVFTRALIPLLARPGMTIREVTETVRSDVRKLARSAGKDQFPTYYDELDGNFVFIPATAENTAEGVPPDPCDGPRKDWPAIKAAQDPDALAVFSATYQACPVQVALAEAELSRLKAMHAGALPATAPDPDPPSADGTPPGAVIAQALPLPVPGAVAAIGNGANDVAASAPLPREDASRAAQEELQRLGCYAGAIDGLWGKGSRKALTDFARHGALTLTSTEPDASLIALLRSQPGRVCPLDCGARYVAVKGTCRLKSCPTGQTLKSDGRCSAPAKTKPEPEPSGKCYSMEGSPEVCDK